MSQLEGANVEFLGAFGSPLGAGVQLQNKRTMEAVPHLFRKKPHSRSSAKPIYTACRRGYLALHVQEVRSRVGQLDPAFLDLGAHPVRVTARGERRTLAHTALH